MAQKKQQIKSRASQQVDRKSRTSGRTKDADALPTRYILVPIFFALAVFSGFSCVSRDGFILNGVAKFFCGLVGVTGFYLMPFLFFALFVIGAFFAKRHLVRRSVCASLAALFVASIAHIALDPIGLPGGLPHIGVLYTTGVNGLSGGVLGGLVGGLFRAAFNRVFGIVLLVVLTILCLASVFDLTVIGIIRAIKNRPRPEPEEEPEPKDPAAVMVNHLAQRHIERTARKKRISDFDIPVDDGPRKAEKPKAKTPDQVLGDELEETEHQKENREEGSVIPEEFSPQTTPETAPTPVKSRIPSKKDKKKAPPVAEPDEDDVGLFEAPAEISPQAAPASQPGAEKVTSDEARESAVDVAREVAEKAQQEKIVYSYPPLTLLKSSGPSGIDATYELRENSRRLNEALQSFKIEAKICNVTRGPSVTRYEVELAQGVRLAKITTLQNDLALALGAASVRISAIPDKIAMVGIEVPNKQVTKVALREVIGSPRFITAKSKSAFAVGKDIGGECIVGDIAQLPHLLIAGTTGSGKSVCMNSLIVSLLYKASPEDVKLIMVDPKMVELGIYNGIPHLLIPVVTDPKKAAGSLQWAVSEMMRRYKLMYDASVRDLESLNRIIEANGEGEQIPQIVVIIDELADLMMVAAKEVEDSIVRIAQMGRASGIHLVIATQRPSADVITGIMKANIPSRIAFAVASAMESRIILDTQGAEKLVGKGDMLYAPLGRGKPQRVQGCFVSDEEVEAVASYVKENFTSTYSQEVMDEIERKSEQGGKGTKATDEDFDESGETAGDELLPDAVDVFLETGQASVSMLQRRLKLGYARAARIVDEMEEKGIVGPFVGSKPRAILITKEQWRVMRNGGEQPAETVCADDDPFEEDDVIPELIP